MRTWRKGRSVDPRQAKHCVLVIVVGAGLFLMSSLGPRGSFLVAALSILGSVVFLVGSFTLFLVLVGFTGRPFSKDRGTREQTTVSCTESSGRGYEQEELSPAIVWGARTETRAPQSTPFLVLPVCPSLVQSCQLQPPPTYEQAVAMSHRMEVPTSLSSTSQHAVASPPLHQ